MKKQSMKLAVLVTLFLIAGLFFPARGQWFQGNGKMTTTNSVQIGFGSSSARFSVLGGPSFFNGQVMLAGSNALRFSTYGGGFYMTDNTWIRTYGNKSFYHNSGTMRTDGTFQVGPSGNRFVVTSGGNVGIGVTSPAYKLQVAGNTYMGGNLRIAGGGYIDDDGTFGGNGDDWVKLSGFIEMKSNTDSYGIVLRDKDANDYLGLTQVNGNSYLADTGPYTSYFLKGSGRNIQLGGNLTGKTVNNGYSNLYRFGGLYLTWDSDSYGNNTHHSIRSTYGDSYGDDITINSYDNLRFNLDANNNNAESYFEIGQHTTGTANIMFRVVSPTGRVGIGTANPGQKLHVSTGTSGDAVLRLEADTDNNNENDNAFIEFRQDGNATRAEIGYLNDNFFAIAQQGSMSGSTRPAIRLGIDLNGNVGIGKTNPAYKLDVNGAVNATAILINGQELTNTTSPWVQTGNNVYYNTGNIGIGTSTPSFALDVNGAVNATELLVNGQPVNLEPNVWSSNGGYVFLTNGNVGIGTTTPQQKLEVNGNIRTREVVVTQNDWPDYVFREGYPLMSLEELEQYIIRHHRLPGVPGAVQVRENGAGVGEIQKILLQKIEELTLHLIEMNKKLGQLEKENARLKVLVERINAE